jgi:hypothetical protein
VKASDVEPTPVAPTELALVASIEKSKGGFVALLVAWRKTGLKPMISPVTAYKALLFDELIAVKPLA